MTTATTHAPPDPNDLLMGGGVPSASFAKIGDSVTGRITEPPKTQQQTDFTTRELKYWDNGDPMYHVVVTLQTEEIDDNIEDDDGRRRIYLKNNMKNAVADAVRKAGSKGLEVGGVLTVTYTANGEVKKKGSQPPKLYSATYVPASSAALNDDRSEDDPPFAATGQAKPMKYPTYAAALKDCKSGRISEDEFKAALKNGGFAKWNEAASTFAEGFIVNTIATRGLKSQSAPLDDEDIPF